MHVARKFTLVVAGHDEAGMEEALAEALRRIKAGNLSGVDSNDTGAFYFEGSHDVPDGELPAGL